MPPTWLRRTWAPVARRPLIALAVPVFSVLAVQVLIKRPSEWEEVYVHAARALLAGQDIYAAGTAYLYPPFQAFLAVPFTLLPSSASRLGLYAASVLSIVGLVRAAWELATGRTIDQFDAADRRAWAVLGLGLLASGPYLLNAVAHQQTDCIIAFLVVAGCAGILRGREASGAILIGLAAAFKGPPLLFAAYLLFRRRWLGAGLVVAVAFGANLLPDLVASPPEGGLWLQAWLRRIVLPTQQLAVPLGQWGSELIYNQALGGTLQRLLGAVLDPRMVKLLTYGLLLAMTVASVAAALIGQRAGRASLRPGDLPSQSAIECAVVIILMLLMSPMSGKAHFGPTLLAAFCLARLALSGSRAALIFVGLATAFALPANKDLAGATLYGALLWGGTFTLSAVCLWIGCIVAMVRGEGRGPAAGMTGSIVPFVGQSSTVR